MNCPRTWGNSTRVFGSKSSALTFACREIQSKILQRVYNRATAEDQKWIVRIVLKGTTLSSTMSVSDNVGSDMVISVKETTVLSVFHPDAEDLFNTCSDLKKVAWELSDPTRRLNPEVQLISCPSESTAHAMTGQSHPVIPSIRPYALQTTET
jgi:hypothetical protein